VRLAPSIRRESPASSLKPGYVQKPVHDGLGFPHIFRHLAVDQHSRSHRPRYHQQLFGESHGRRFPGFRSFHCVWRGTIPAGFLVERFTEKPTMVIAFQAGRLGSLSFALFPRYGVAIVSCFTISAGMATLHVAVNPLLRIAGGEEHHAFKSTVAQLDFGSASLSHPTNLLLPCGESEECFARQGIILANSASAHSTRLAMGSFW